MAAFQPLGAAVAERKCQGTNARGEPCHNPAVGPDGWCDAHRPGNGGEMRRRGLRGPTLHFPARLISYQAVEQPVLLDSL